MFPCVFLPPSPFLPLPLFSFDLLSYSGKLQIPACVSIHVSCFLENCLTHTHAHTHTQTVFLKTMTCFHTFANLKDSGTVDGVPVVPTDFSPETEVSGS